jgi:hypothetical protein
MAEAIRQIDGSQDWASGVDSSRPTTVAGPQNPHGLQRSQLAWLINGSVRGGGIQTRTGYVPRITNAAWSGLFNGAWMYQPSSGDPYLVICVGGKVWKADLNTYGLSNLSATFGKSLPATEPLYHFTQGSDYATGKEILVIQAGDLVTNPLFWNDVALTQSAGFIAPGNAGNQIPPASAMDFYMGRIWYARGRTYIAGDITGPGKSIIKTTENPFALNGDGLSVPSSAGSIRMLAHTAELDTALGQGRLLIGTPKSIYRCNVPVSRDDWSNPNFANQQPLQTVAQIRYGPVSDRSAVVVNGDLFYQSLEPAIRSLQYSTRYFGQWSNTPISRNENRALRFNDRSLLRYSSGIEFSNRLLQTVLPYQTPVGVAHRGILPLDFDLISSLEEKLPPAWEGMSDGIDILQLLEGDFGGLQRAFAVVYSRKTADIQIWEITQDQRFDAGDRRIEMTIETPSYTWGNAFALKQLETMELWLDQMAGSVKIDVYFRPDQSPCYVFWHSFTECAAKDCTEDPDVTQPCYPSQPYCPGFKATLTLPKPPAPCIAISGRPANRGYQFQVKLVVRGWVRIRGIMLHALPVQKAPFEGLVC